MDNLRIATNEELDIIKIKKELLKEFFNESSVNIPVDFIRLFLDVCYNDNTSLINCTFVHKVFKNIDYNGGYSNFCK